MHRLRLVPLVVVLVGIACFNLFAADGTPPAGPVGDWPQFRGPGGLGVSADSEVPLHWSGTEGVRWKTPLPGGGASSPVIIGSRIFLTCFTGAPPAMPGGHSAEPLRRHLLCLDRESGKILWDSAVEGRLPDRPETGQNHGYASSTPAADAERVYVHFGKSGVFAFDHQGRQLWHADVGDKTHQWGSCASPLLFGKLLIVNASVESESLVALDKESGAEVWRTGGIREAFNTPLLAPAAEGQTDLVLAYPWKVLGYDPATGQQRWWTDSGPITWYMVPSLVAQEGTAYCIGGASGQALAVRTGGSGEVTHTHRLWTASSGSNVSSPVIHNGYLYFAKDSPGIAYCLDAKTGQTVYRERLENAGQVYASALLAGGRLYYLSRTGRTFVLPAEPKFQVLAVNDLGEPGTFNASPAVSGGRLFLRSDRCLYCIEGERSSGG